MRLFVASLLSPGLRRQLSSLSGELARASGGMLRPVPWDSEHLTHAFLGEVSVPVPDLLSALAPLAERVGPTIELGRAAVFPARGRPRLVCLQVAGRSDALRALTSTVRELLSALHPELATGPAKPAHVTLARFGRRARSRDAREIAAQMSRIDLAEWTASDTLTAVEVIHSRLSTAGARYEVLGRVPLAGPAAPASDS